MSREIKLSLTKEEIGYRHGLMMHDPIQSHYIGQAMDEYYNQAIDDAMKVIYNIWDNDDDFRISTHDEIETKLQSLKK